MLVTGLCIWENLPQVVRFTKKKILEFTVIFLNHRAHNITSLHFFSDASIWCLIYHSTCVLDILQLYHLLLGVE